MIKEKINSKVNSVNKIIVFSSLEVNYQLYYIIYPVDILFAVLNLI